MWSIKITNKGIWNKFACVNPGSPLTAYSNKLCSTTFCYFKYFFLVFVQRTHWHYWTVEVSSRSKIFKTVIHVLSSTDLILYVTGKHQLEFWIHLHIFPTLFDQFLYGEYFVLYDCILSFTIQNCSLYVCWASLQCTVTSPIGLIIDLLKSTSLTCFCGLYTSVCVMTE